MYNHLLNGDELVKLTKPQELDLKDYIFMRRKKFPTMVKWNSIKSMVITKGGMTLWQLSEKYLNSQFRPIGQLESPVNLFDWVLKNNS